MQTTHLRSGHLDIKDAQCAETKDVLKTLYHIISRLGAQKGRFGRPKIEFLSKVDESVGKIGIDLILIDFIS